MAGVEDVKFSFLRYRGTSAKLLHDKVKAVEIIDAHRLRFVLHMGWGDRGGARGRLDPAVCLLRPLRGDALAETVKGGGAALRPRSGAKAVCTLVTIDEHMHSISQEV